MAKTIKEIVESYGVKLWPIGEGILRGFCPMHHNVNTASFTVYTSTDSFFCFGESVGGDAANFLSRMEGISYKEAKERISGNSDTLTLITETLDGMHVVNEEVDYNSQTNIAISKYCRDVMLAHPEKIDKVMNFLQHLDKELQSTKISAIVMERLIKESREL